MSIVHTNIGRTNDVAGNRNQLKGYNLGNDGYADDVELFRRHHRRANLFNSECCNTSSTRCCGARLRTCVDDVRVRFRWAMDVYTHGHPCSCPKNIDELYLSTTRWMLPATRHQPQTPATAATPSTFVRQSSFCPHVHTDGEMRQTTLRGPVRLCCSPGRRHSGNWWALINWSIIDNDCMLCWKSAFASPAGWFRSTISE